MVLLVQLVVDHMLLIRPACCAFRKVVLWPVALVERAKLPDPQGGSVDEDLPDALDLWLLKPAGSPEEAVRLDVGDYVLCACPVMINASIVQELKCGQVAVVWFFLFCKQAMFSNVDAVS